VNSSPVNKKRNLEILFKSVQREGDHVCMYFSERVPTVLAFPRRLSTSNTKSVLTPSSAEVKVEDFDGWIISDLSGTNRTVFRTEFCWSERVQIVNFRKNLCCHPSRCDFVCNRKLESRDDAINY
jgi:hypothetical protein